MPNTTPPSTLKIIFFKNLNGLLKIINQSKAYVPSAQAQKLPILLDKILQEEAKAENFLDSY